MKFKIEDKINQLLTVRNCILLPHHGYKGYDCSKPISKLDESIDALIEGKDWNGGIL
jgi:hypothetical protein